MSEQNKGEAMEAKRIERWQLKAHPMDGPYKRVDLACQEIEQLRAALASAQEEIAELRKDAERFQWLCNNSYDKSGVTQIHTWVHSWEPHTVTGEPVEWKQRIRGPVLAQFVDAAVEDQARAGGEVQP